MGHPARHRIDPTGYARDCGQVADRSGCRRVGDTERRGGRRWSAGLEYPAVLGPASGTLALAGAGKLSLDELLNQRLGGTGFVTDIGYAPSSPRCGLGRPFARHGEATRVA